jgi:spermidine synthase
MNAGRVVDGWFSETDLLWPGQAMTYQVDEVLYECKSKFQNILVMKTYVHDAYYTNNAVSVNYIVCCRKRYGTMLALDGVVQCSEKDECVYQEMMTHLPLFCHPHPKTVTTDSRLV